VREEVRRPARHLAGRGGHVRPRGPHRRLPGTGALVQLTGTVDAARGARGDRSTRTADRYGRRVAGRAVVVTGASRGVGRAVAVAFAAAGDRVAVHHRDSAALAVGTAGLLDGKGHVAV